MLYEYQVRDQFRELHDLAKRFQDRYSAGGPSADLVQDLRVLEAAYTQLDSALPQEVDRGHLDRHLYWIGYWLGRNEPENCRGDVEGLVSFDLAGLENGFRAWAASRQHYDRQFAEGVAPLLKGRHLDSAVRKAFVVLKERMVNRFQVSPDLDGPRLVNEIVGRNGRLAGKIADEEREALRNLLDGLYGIFRNRYTHHDVEPEWYEAEAVLAMVNWALKQIERLPAEGSNIAG